jgi:HEAT repeat protein
MILAAAVSFGTDETKTKPAREEPLSFEEKVRLSLMDPYFLDYGVVFGLQPYGHPQLRSFPRELVQALQGKDDKKRLITLRYLNTLSGMVRHSCSEDENPDVPRQFRLALDRRAAAITTGLKASLKDPVREARFLAASTLFALEPDHKEALAILTAGLKTKNAKVRAESCENVGVLSLRHPSIVACLCDCLGAKEAAVRRAAARALMETGPAGKEAVCPLVELAKSKEACGEADSYWMIAGSRRANLAVLALASMGEHAAPAVPALMKLLETANAEDAPDIVFCLGKIGPPAREAAPAVRRFLRRLIRDGRPETARKIDPWPRSYHAKADTPAGAAAALLSIVPGDPEAVAVLQRALKTRRTRTEAAEACYFMGIKDKALLNTLKEGGDSAAAAYALANYGPAAAGAVPTLEEAIPVQKDRQLCRAMTECLAKIGKAGLPALLRLANEKGSEGELSRSSAILALGRFPRDSAVVVPVLIKALADEKTRESAVIALGKLGRQARQAGFALSVVYVVSAFQQKVTLAGDELTYWALSQVGGSHEQTQGRRQETSHPRAHYR